jgi:hypothetical protein
VGYRRVTRKLEFEGESPMRQPKGFDRNHPLIEKRCVGAVDREASVRPESHEGVHFGVPDDEAAGGVHSLHASESQAARFS